MKKTFLSPSTLNLYRECPRCFYLHMRYEIKRPRGPMPSIATGLDSVFKQYFDHYRATGTLPPDLAGDMSGHLIKRLKPTYYYDILPGVCILGKLDDCLVTDEGSHAPLDHKTRASPARDVHPAYQLQMEIYSILLDGSGLKASDRAYLIYYFPIKIATDTGTAKNIAFDMDIKKVDVDKEHARDVIMQAVSCLKSQSLPEASAECGYCGWIQEAGSLQAPEFGEQNTQKKHPPSREPDDKEAEKPQETHRDSLF